MDLNQLWAKGQASWDAYRNPSLSADQASFLMPSYSNNASYQPWVSPSALGADAFATNAVSGMPTDMNFANLGQATPVQGLMTDFKNLGIGQQVQAVGSVINGAANAYNAYNSTKIAKDQLAFTKNSWNKQFQANKNLTNASLADRQNSRVASNPGAYQSVDAYMNKYGIK